MLTLNVGCHYYILRANCRYILHDFQMKRKRGDIQYLVAVVKWWSHCETGSMMAVVSISQNKILCQKFKMTISQCEKLLRPSPANRNASSDSVLNGFVVFSRSA